MQKPDYMITFSDLQRSNDKLRANIVELHLERKQLKQEIAAAKKEVLEMMKQLSSAAECIGKKKSKTVGDNYKWTKEDFEKAKNDPTLRRELEEAFYSALLDKRVVTTDGQ